MIFIQTPPRKFDFIQKLLLYFSDTVHQAGSIFILVSLLVFCKMLYTQNQDQYKKLNCTEDCLGKIENISIVYKNPGTKSTLYIYEIQFFFTKNNGTYHGTCYEKSYAYKDKPSYCSYRKGEKINLKINPKDPSQFISVLPDSEYSAEEFATWGLISFVIGLVFLLLNRKIFINYISLYSNGVYKPTRILSKEISKKYSSSQKNYTKYKYTYQFSDGVIYHFELSDYYANHEIGDQIGILYNPITNFRIYLNPLENNPKLTESGCFEYSKDNYWKLAVPALNSLLLVLVLYLIST